MNIDQPQRDERKSLLVFDITSGLMTFTTAHGFQHAHPEVATVAGPTEGGVGLEKSLNNSAPRKSRCHTRSLLI